MLRSTTLNLIRSSSSTTTRSIINRISKATMASVNEPVVLFKQVGNANFITLNRPAKLNSLNTEMIELMTPKLVEWAQETGNKTIILNSNSPKALCAGGDVAECSRTIKAGNPQYPCDFFQKEYNLNYIISTFPKPYVAIMDGITFGGGVGLSVHAPFRVATEKTKVAMPEMDIGFFPDVGATFFLPRLDNRLGYYYALTNTILTGLDAYMAGFATHYIKSENIPILEKRLSEVVNHLGGVKHFQEVNQVLDGMAEKKIPDDYKFPLSTEEIALINKAFNQKSIFHVIEYLKKDGSEFALKTLAKLNEKPTTSLAIAFDLMNEGVKNTIRQQFELEMIAATNLSCIDPAENDFANGVAHKLIHKIKSPPFPKWTPAEKVDNKFIQSMKYKSKNVLEHLKTPLLNPWFGVDYKEYPFKMGLPTNQDVAEYITGTDGSGRTYLPTPSELMKHFKAKYYSKAGIEYKINEILAIHGNTKAYDNKYVGWTP